MAESSSSPQANSQEWPWSKEAGRKAPNSVVPERRSSKIRLRDRVGPGARSVRGADFPLPPPPLTHQTPKNGSTIRSRGRSSSPLRRPDSILRKAPSRTVIPNVFPTEILNEPRLSNPRLLLDLRLSSPIFMGGATVEGELHLVVDGGLSKSKRKQQAGLTINRITVSVVGIESCKNKQEMFRALTTDLVDESHPLPFNMSPESAGNGSWAVIPSSSILPFCIDLPVMVGPPPYESKRAGIKYLVSTTVEASSGKKRLPVRQSKEIVVLSVHDPEKALVNLASPLVVMDELHFPHRQGAQKVILTAGVHRQTWISGYPVFVDVHIDNRSAKGIRKIELRLEKTTTFYAHSAATTNAGTADSLRIPDHILKETVARKDASDSLRGIFPLSQDFSTYQMDLPAGLVSIETAVFSSKAPLKHKSSTRSGSHRSKRLKVQLPITIIHPNSIDIPTNALAQVTASVEHKHRNLTSASGTGSPYRYHPGQAFTAARRQSYLQLRKHTIGSGDLEALTRTLEASPRRLERQPRVSPRRMQITRRQSAAMIGNNDHQQHARTLSKQNASFDNGHMFRVPRISNDTTRLGEPRVSFEDRNAGPASTKGHQLSNVQPRSSLEAKVHKGLRGISFDAMNRGPRLQKSTSGLAFDFSDESDKENWAPKRKG